MVLQGLQPSPGGEVRGRLDSSFPGISVLPGVTPQVLDLSLAGDDDQTESAVNVGVVELHPDVLQDEKAGRLRARVSRLEVEEKISS